MTDRAAQTFTQNHKAQRTTWAKQVPILKNALSDLPPYWRIIIEYPMLRLGHRPDVILVSDRAIFVMEFKVDAVAFEKTSARQVEDYALDLHYFHAGSTPYPIIPILVATNAVAITPAFPLLWHQVSTPFLATGACLPNLLVTLAAAIPPNNIIIEAWETAAYRPIPTIIDAATLLYAKHAVSDISTARTDIQNLGLTSNYILSAIRDAKREQNHVIVFVTGIPGAGKTLCGLNAVFGTDTGAAFLTGNLPLVHVLREALARDAANADSPDPKARKPLTPERRKTKVAIQPLTDFIKHNLGTSDPPHEHVIVFDEAQRAWDAKKGMSMFNLPDSEAALFLDIMRRHADYAVIIALVGNGQEINTGEAGLSEWGRALTQRPDWRVRTAEQTFNATEPRQRLFASRPANVIVDPALHLHVPVRQIKSAATADWVEAVLRGDMPTAKTHARDGAAFYITRSLVDMRRALKTFARGQRRAGLVCSTGARRLIADGIWPDFPHLDSSAIAHWFLKRWPDVRASDALEIPATEFACQGLELDHVGLCWGGDLVWTGKWLVRAFSGTKWIYPKIQEAKDFRLNSYRVLMSRARYETIIWVPKGDVTDETRSPDVLDDTANYLLECGAAPLPEIDVSQENHQRDALLI